MQNNGPHETVPKFQPSPKIERSPFDPLVKRVFPAIERRVPGAITANEVTIAGHVATLITVLALVLSARSAWWCLLAAVMIFAHWFADTLDGPMARRRGTSRLGHFLDHYGDAVSTVLIAIAIFLVPGGHPVIGMGVAIVYLLSLHLSQVRAEITHQLEIPPFGPTELHFLSILALAGHVAFSFGKALPWVPSLTGDAGLVTRLLGFEQGLSLIDHAGLILVTAGTISLIFDALGVARRVARMDREASMSD